MITLEDLWYGNINPHEQFLDGNEKLKELLPIMAKTKRRFQLISHKNKQSGSKIRMIREVSAMRGARHPFTSSAVLCSVSMKLSTA